jgi:hypothetical protein
MTRFLALAAAISSSVACTPTSPQTDWELASSGTYFGYCVGECRRDMYVDQHQANLAFLQISDAASNPLTSVDGVPSTAFWNNVDDLVLHLDQGIGIATTPAVYGCPDATDMGGAFVEFRRISTGTLHRVDWDPNNVCSTDPAPSELADLGLFLRDVATDLEACTTTSYITPLCP